MSPARSKESVRFTCVVLLSLPPVEHNARTHAGPYFSNLSTNGIGVVSVFRMRLEITDSDKHFQQTSHPLLLTADIVIQHESDIVSNKP